MVVVIAGVVMAIAFPKTSELRRGAGLRSAKQITQSYLTIARQAAVRRGQPVLFTVAGDSIGIVTTIDDEEVFLEGPIDLTARFGVNLTTDAVAIEYNARGLARVTDAPVVLRLSYGNATDSLCLTGLGMLARCGL